MPRIDGIEVGSAEAWLRARGITPEPVTGEHLDGPIDDGSTFAVEPEPAADAPAEPVATAATARAAEVGPEPIAEPAPVAATGPSPSAREVALLVTEPAVSPPPADKVPDGSGLSDQMAKAVSYAVRATANAPMTESRLRDRWIKREVPDAVLEPAMRRCREMGIVDDRAFAKAIIGERRERGHAPLRIRTDLQKRGISRELAEELLGAIPAEDPEAAAFAAGRERAAAMSALDAEVAFRRLVAFLARRGHREGIARKVARELVYAAREQQRTAER